MLLPAVNVPASAQIMCRLINQLITCKGACATLTLCGKQYDRA